MLWFQCNEMQYNFFEYKLRVYFLVTPERIQTFFLAAMRFILSLGVSNIFRHFSNPS